MRYATALSSTSSTTAPSVVNMRRSCARCKSIRLRAKQRATTMTHRRGIKAKRCTHNASKERKRRRRRNALGRRQRCGRRRCSEQVRRANVASGEGNDASTNLNAKTTKLKERRERDGERHLFVLFGDEVERRFVKVHRRRRQPHCTDDDMSAHNRERSFKGRTVTASNLKEPSRSMNVGALVLGGKLRSDRGASVSDRAKKSRQTLYLAEVALVAMRCVAFSVRSSE